MVTVTALVVDDEEPARQRLRDLLADEDDIELVGECADGPDAVEAIRRHRPDLLFLDVQMPEMDGFQVLESLKVGEVSAVVFVTAYDRHALAAFDAGALDYLLKPFTAARFRETLARVRRSLGESPGTLLARLDALLAARQTGAGRSPARLPVPTDSGVRLLALDDIGWIEADRNHVIVHARGEAHRMRNTLKAMCERLAPAGLVRIHQSYAVNVHHIRELQPWTHGELVVGLRDGTSLVSSRTYTAALREMMEG